MSNVTPFGLENDIYVNSAKVEIVLFVNCINCFEIKSSVDLKADKACFELRIRRNNG